MDLMCNLQTTLASGEFDDELERLRTHERQGLVTITGRTVTLTDVGRVFVRVVASVFDAYLSRAPRAFSRTV
jgi:oxygen-independent coproporphyrinogen-3 oxidase